MRQIILDTETTGLSWESGHRIVEIGAVELLERRPSGRVFHKYINPEREFESGAQEVTGLSLDFLADKPKFSEIVDDLLAFIDGAELVAHNAAFDVGFLNHELALAGPQFGRVEERVRIEDTLALARQRFPGQRNSLDALCKRLGVDNSHRQLHGALLDAQLLCEVYLALTSGQEEIGFALPEPATETHVMTAAFPGENVLSQRPSVIVSAEERQAHETRLAHIRTKAGRCLWEDEKKPKSET